VEFILTVCQRQRLYGSSMKMTHHKRTTFYEIMYVHILWQLLWHCSYAHTHPPTIVQTWAEYSVYWRPQPMVVEDITYPLIVVLSVPKTRKTDPLDLVHVLINKHTSVVWLYLLSFYWYSKTLTAKQLLCFYISESQKTQCLKISMLLQIMLHVITLDRY